MYIHICSIWYKQFLHWKVEELQDFVDNLFLKPNGVFDFLPKKCQSGKQVRKYISSYIIL